MAALVAILPGKFGASYRWVSLGVTIIQSVLVIMMLLTFSLTQGAPNTIDSFQFVERTSWFSLNLGSLGYLQAEYFLGTDGLSITLVALNAIIMLISTIASFNVTDRPKGYFSLLLVLNGSIMGCFLALDFLLFYLFFEFMLLPMFFLIGLWGGPRREYASIKFFLYTLLGSVFLLIVMIGLYTSVMDPVMSDGDTLVRTFNMVYMANPENLIPGSLFDGSHEFMSVPLRMWGFLLLFIGFAIKIPVVPLHTWLPDAHVEAPTPISVILAGILLKIGAYGLLRTAYLIFPDGALEYAWLVGLLGVISIIYGALNALASKDLKRLVAYSSVSHMGFVLLGVSSNTVEGVSGAIFQLVSHGIISAALFLIAGVLYDRTHDRIIDNYSGLTSKMPRFAAFTVLFFFASLGLPGMSGFIAEVLTILGAFVSSGINGLLSRWLAVTSVLGLILAAAYYLWTLQRMYFGPFYYRFSDGAELKDLTGRESGLLIPLAIMTLLLGIFPGILLDVVSGSINAFVQLVAAGENWPKG
jgi:NADH-quinone oxidoreductase subunit M